MPISARIQFFRNMATSATIRVMEFERMLLKVLVMTDSTPSISLVILVMTSPWLLVVKNLWDMLWRCLNILLRMSKVMCWAIQVFI